MDQVYEKLLDIDDVYDKVETRLRELKAEKDGLQILLEDFKSRLVLAKAKLQQLNVTSSALLKPQHSEKKVQQTQTTSTGTTTLETVPQSVETGQETQGNIINIPDDEQDIADKLA